MCSKLYTTECVAGSFCLVDYLKCKRAPYDPGEGCVGIFTNQKPLKQFRSSAIVLRQLEFKLQAKVETDIILCDQVCIFMHHQLGHSTHHGVAGLFKVLTLLDRQTNLRLGPNNNISLLKLQIASLGQHRNTTHNVQKISLTLIVL